MLAVLASKPTSSAIPTRQPPSGGSPATRMSPPRLTRTPPPTAASMAAAARSAASALAVAPRSSMTPAGTVTSRRSGSSCDPAPAARGHRRLAQGACVLAGPREVLVVAEPDQRPPAGRIDVPVGERGGREGHSQRLREQRADLDRAAARVVDPPEFGVGPEPRAGRVHRVQFRGEQVVGRFQAVRMGDEQRRERPERPEGSRARRRGRGRHQPPACDGLDTVGFGAGAELVDGAGAGAELGGASVGDGDELCGPARREPEELDELEGPGEREPLPDGLAAWPACAVGCTPGAAFRAAPGDAAGWPTGRRSGRGGRGGRLGAGGRGGLVGRLGRGGAREQGREAHRGDRAELRGPPGQAGEAAQPGRTRGARRPLRGLVSITHESRSKQDAG